MCVRGRSGQTVCSLSLCRRVIKASMLNQEPLFKAVQILMCDQVLLCVYMDVISAADLGSGVSDAYGLWVGCQ